MKTFSKLLFLNFLIMVPTYLFSQSSKNDLKINYSHVYKESSKDSHSIIEKWNLEGETLTYTKSYTGHLGKKQPEKQNQKLSKNQLELIEKLLEEKQLYKNIPSLKYSDFESPYTAIHVNLILEKKKQKFEIDLYNISTLISEDLNYKDIKALEILLDSFLKK
jgi:hypothetical protein